MPRSSAYVATAPRLVGRAGALAEIVALAATRPGVVVIAGERGVGRARMARETAARMALDGAVVIAAEEPGEGIARMEAALIEAGHHHDPARAARLRPMVILLGRRPDEPGLAAELARRLAGSRALVLMTGATSPRPTLPGSCWSR